MVRKQDLGKLLKRTGVQLSLFAIGGAILVALGLLIELGEARVEWLKLTGEVLKHLGAGAIVAVFVAIIFHVQEFKEHFESFAGKILMEEEYLKKLKSPVLTEVRKKAAKVLIQELLQNKKYEYQRVLDRTEDVLFGKLFPTGAPGSGLYRIGYDETIVIESLNTESVKTPILKISTTTRYTVVAPSTDSLSRMVTIMCQSQ